MLAKPRQCQARFEGSLGSIVQVDVFVKHHPKVSEGVRVRQNFTIIEKWWQMFGPRIKADNRRFFCIHRHKP
eukprot:992753-Pelagomonas_calceolata.AAC.1